MLRKINIQPYWLTITHSIQDVFEYRVDFFIHTFKYAFMVIMAALVWVAVAKASPNATFSINETIQYFFFAAIVYSLSNFHTFYIEDDIKLGYLSKYLVKPLSAFWFYWSVQAGKAAVETALKLVVMAPLLWLIGYGLSINPLHAVIFMLYLPLMFSFAFNQFALISGLTFWLEEAWALRWSFTILFRFLAGLLVPLAYLPNWTQAILAWTPYPYLAYVPIRLLQNELSWQAGTQGLFVLLGWAIAVAMLRNWLWQLGYRKYESTGV